MGLAGRRAATSAPTGQKLSARTAENPRNPQPVCTGTDQLSAIKHRPATVVTIDSPRRPPANQVAPDRRLIAVIMVSGPRIAATATRVPAALSARRSPPTRPVGNRG